MATSARCRLSLVLLMPHKPTVDKTITHNHAWAMHLSGDKAHWLHIGSGFFVYKGNSSLYHQQRARGWNWGRNRPSAVCHAAWEKISVFFHSEEHLIKISGYMKSCNDDDSRIYLHYAKMFSFTAVKQIGETKSCTVSSACVYPCDKRKKRHWYKTRKYWYFRDI